MAAQRQVPGGAFVNETTTKQRQIPGSQMLGGIVAAGGAVARHARMMLTARSQIRRHRRK